MRPAPALESNEELDDMNAKQVANLRQLSLEQRTVILVSGTGTGNTMNQLLALLPRQQSAK